MATSPKRMRHEFSIDSLVSDRSPLGTMTSSRPLHISNSTPSRQQARSPSAKSDVSSNGSPPRHRHLFRPEAHRVTSPNSAALSDYFSKARSKSDAIATSLSSPSLPPHFPHPAFMGAGTTLGHGSPPNPLLHPAAFPPLHGLLSATGTPQLGSSAMTPGLAAAQMASLAAHAQEHSRSLSGLLPGAHPHPLQNPHQLAAMFPGGLPHSAAASLAGKDNLPLYSWLLARQNSYLTPGLAGE